MYDESCGNRSVGMIRKSSMHLPPAVVETRTLAVLKAEVAVAVVNGANTKR
jgi:hypothetical protein